MHAAQVFGSRVSDSRRQFRLMQTKCKGAPGFPLYIRLICLLNHSRIYFGDAPDTAISSVFEGTKRKNVSAGELGGSN